MEIWKNIKGYENLYQVSNLGRIKRLRGFIYKKNHTENKIKYIKQEKILKTFVNSRGYFVVTLHKNGNPKQYQLHRLIALSFIDIIEGRPCVNHKNGKKTDNRISNLEWVTIKENSQHSFDNELQIIWNRKELKCSNGIIFKSSYHAAEWINNNIFGNSKKVKSIATNIRACVAGRQSIAFGFKWFRNL